MELKKPRMQAVFTDNKPGWFSDGWDGWELWDERLEKVGDLL